jgi:hypothetical protein
VRHPLGEEFPREGFVQRAIEAHFAGWERDETTTADLVCLDVDRGVTWVIEAKGETAAVGLDFRTGLGQLLAGMTRGRKANYVLAMPDTPAFEGQRAAVSDWVRRALNLW